MKAAIQVTFIVPSFQQARYLGDALQSILDQKLDPETYEILVFDGGSVDGSPEILAAYPELSYWESVPDRGQSHALNKGLVRAKGEVIAWLNSDDLYFPGALSTVLNFFAKNRSVDVVYGRAQDVDSDGNRIREFPTRHWSSAALLESCFISQPAAFFRREFAQKNGLLREDLHYALDYEYWLRASEWAHFHHLPRFLACNRVHAAAKSSSLTLSQLRQSAMLSYQAGGKWQESWLRRIASAEGRRLLQPVALSESGLRRLVSHFYYRIFYSRIRLGKEPFVTEK